MPPKRVRTVEGSTEAQSSDSLNWAQSVVEPEVPESEEEEEEEENLYEEHPNELFDVGVLNAATLNDAVEQCRSIDEFLHADLNMSFHSTYIADPENLFHTSYDVDGLVMELKRLTGLLAMVHYVLLPEVQAHMLKYSYHIVKKHFDLTASTPEGIQALRNSVCHTLGYVDGGYHLSLVFLPSCLKDPDTRLFKRPWYNSHACELLNNIRHTFQFLLSQASVKDKCRPTLQKQISSETSSFHVLPQDCYYIYSLLDQAITGSTGCDFIRPALFLTRFGQKLNDNLDLTDVVAPAEVASLSVHLACTVSARDTEIHTLFSRFGLENLVGSRGSLYSVLGMHEATNYQTDLDHLPLTLSDSLLRVLKDDGRLTFLQLYVDSPHVHLKMPFKHPVSGTIVTCGLSHPQFQKALLSRAEMYVMHMKDLKEKLVSQLSLRIEQVRLYEDWVPTAICPGEHFCEPALFAMLGENALVIPFSERAYEHGLLSTLSRVLDHVVTELWRLYMTSEGVARYDACWKSFQIELLLEELFYGHPLSTGDYSISVSLGTNTVNPKSLTHTRGFIGLAPHTSASAGDEPPPLHHWTRDDLQRMRIERIFPLCQTLDATPAVIGSVLLKLLLCDIYRRNTQIPILALSADKPPGRLAGSQKLEVLCENLSIQKSFPAPLTFGRARLILVRAGIDVKSCLMQGFREENLKFFPSFLFRNPKGAHKIFWNTRDYMVLEFEGSALLLSSVANATLKVCTEIERRSLAFNRYLEKYRECGMIWMAKVLRRLPVQLGGELHLKVITFVSCVAMIMNGDYVDYQHLRTLLEEMSPHVTQAMLQKFLIQSKFSLPKVYNFLVYKLHETIEYRVQQKPKVIPVVKKKEAAEMEQQQPYEDVQAVDDQDNIRPMMRSEHRTLPANTQRQWTEEEALLINVDPQVKDKAAYAMYVKTCHEKQVAIRTFKSFQGKRRRILAKVTST